MLFTNSLLLNNTTKFCSPCRYLVLFDKKGTFIKYALNNQIQYLKSVLPGTWALWGSVLL